MSNVEKIHRIFIHEEGRDFAERIINNFDRGRYHVQFKLHEVELANMTDIYESGVSILLLTPQLLDAIAAGNHPKLDTLFPNPKFSILLCHCIDKSKSKISKIISDNLKGFLHWTYINFCSHDDFTNLKLNIMSLVEKSEGVEDVPMTPRLQNFQLWPGEVCKLQQSISLLFARPVDDDEEVKVKVIQEGGSLTLDTQRLNSMTYSFNLGYTVPGMKKIEVFVNKSSYGRVKLHVESKMAQLEHLLHDVTNTIELLCQSLRCEVTREDLDRELLDLLCNYSSSALSSLFSTFDWNKFGETVSKSELPTLLHFGAKFGLVEFCRELIALPGGRQAMRIKNKNNHLPHEIAKQNGFLPLGSELVRQHADSKDKDDYLPVASPFSESAKGSACDFASSPSKEQKEKSRRESYNGEVQTFHRRTSGHSSTSFLTERPRDSLRSSSNSSTEGDIVPIAKRLNDGRVNSEESGISSGSTSSPRLTGYTDRMTMLLDGADLDSVFCQQELRPPSQHASQCAEPKHREETRL